MTSVFLISLKLKCCSRNSIFGHFSLKFGLDMGQIGKKRLLSYHLTPNPIFMKIKILASHSPLLNWLLPIVEIFAIIIFYCQKLKQGLVILNYWILFWKTFSLKTLLKSMWCYVKHCFWYLALNRSTLIFNFLFYRTWNKSLTFFSLI